MKVMIKQENLRKAWRCEDWPNGSLVCNFLGMRRDAIPKSNASFKLRKNNQNDTSHNIENLTKEETTTMNLVQNWFEENNLIMNEKKPSLIRFNYANTGGDQSLLVQGDPSVNEIVPQMIKTQRDSENINKQTSTNTFLAETKQKMDEIINLENHDMDDEDNFTKVTRRRRVMEGSGNGYNQFHGRDSCS
ncbi:hypothetical protein JTB14_031352 [Gonioctena quinquepunctata]|nr:hypothetical protein JTB14_031352 [Gonioctena quinquepunctata]